MSDQRERFEKIVGNHPYSMELDRWESDGVYRSFETRKAWMLWKAACPEGWQAVPKEQTEEMREAGRLAIMNMQGGYDGPSQWEAQLSTAPKPEDV